MNDLTPTPGSIRVRHPLDLPREITRVHGSRSMLAAVPAGSADHILLLEQQLAAAQGQVGALQTELEVARTALATETALHAQTHRCYEAELRESLRLAALHAEASGRLSEVLVLFERLSAENVHLRHQIAGTTPVSVAIAVDRTIRVDAVGDVR